MSYENKTEVLARMIDVGAKDPTARLATASGKIWMNAEALTALRERANPKGDVLALAQGAGIMGAKRTSDWLPLCHPLTLDGVAIESVVEADHVVVRCTVKTTGKTGVEMEALCGVQAALLCIYDMCKIIDPAMRLGDSIVEVKEGGKTGSWRHPETALHIAKEVSVAARASHGALLQGLRVGLLVSSDRCHRGQTEDKSGPLLQTLCEQSGATVVGRTVVADEEAAIAAVVERLAVVILVVGRRELRRDLHELRAHDLQAFFFEARDDAAHETALNGVGLQNDECGFHAAMSCEWGAVEGRRA